MFSVKLMNFLTLMTQFVAQRLEHVIVSQIVTMLFLVTVLSEHLERSDGEILHLFCLR